VTGDSYEPTPRTRVRRKPGRGSYDREAVHAIIDEALSCHVGFVDDGVPLVMPTIHARVGEILYLHGSKASRMLGVLAAGAPCCVTVTLIDGLVLARAALHHSLNYRSVVVLGTAELVTDEDEKRAALEAVVEHIVPGRTAEARAPDVADLKGTEILRLPLEEVSAKVRTGAPVDERADMALPVWAGELPLRTMTGEPVPDPAGEIQLPVPDYVSRWTR
jgi:nitroimidazol reductase NimA-like FMN-containing flavoprotein (pyridoxamine 5'-phosphate oxidase superfamily)